MLTTSPPLPLLLAVVFSDALITEPGAQLRHASQDVIEQSKPGHPQDEAPLEGRYQGRLGEEQVGRCPKVSTAPSS